MIDALNDRNADAFTALVTEDFEWVTALANVAPTAYKGPSGVRQFFDDARAWAKIQARVDELHDLGDRALILGELRWSSRKGWLDVIASLCSVIQFEDGRIKQIHTYRDPNDAWSAAGLGRPRN
jgi:ketosteroid isomerase-like protein